MRADHAQDDIHVELGKPVGAGFMVRSFPGQAVEATSPWASPSPAISHPWIRRRPTRTTGRSTTAFAAPIASGVVEARRPDPVGPRAGPGTGPGQRHDRVGLFVAGRRGLHPGPRPGGHDRDAGPQAAQRRCVARYPGPGATFRRPAFARIRSCPSRWACRPWMRFRARSGHGWALGACARCSPPTWCIRRSMACRRCAPRSPRISRCRAASAARPSQVFVTSGYRHTMELIGHALLKAGDRVWLENPGYPPTRELLGGHADAAAGAVPVDRDGMVVSEGVTPGTARACRRGHAGASEPAVACRCRCPGAGAAGLGRAQPTPGSSRTTTTASTGM